MGIIKNIRNYFLSENTRERLPGEIGGSGTNFFSGFIAEDFNSKLQATNGIKMWNEMRKSDAQVYASLLMLKLPVLGANWFIEASDYEKDGEMHAEFIHRALFDLINFNKFQKESLGFLDFGFYSFEKVFGVDSMTGKIIWKKFAPRIPSSKHSWEKDGEIGMYQILPSDVSGISQPFIPMKKLIHFVHNREGDNFDGVSQLRAAYKHWVYKDNIYKIQGISLERWGVGIPVIYPEEYKSEADKQAAEEMGQNMRANEQSYIVMPSEKWKVEVLTAPNGKEMNMQEAIQHHNRMILMNVLGGFMDLGSEGGGSLALSNNQMRFFELSLEQLAREWAAEMNDAIKELIDLNFEGVVDYPKLRATKIGNFDVEKFANSMEKLTNSGLVLIDSKLREFVRQSADLPDEVEEEIEEIIKSREVERDVFKSDMDKKKDDSEEGKEEEKEDNNDDDLDVRDEDGKKLAEDKKKISNFDDQTGGNFKPFREFNVAENKVDFEKINRFLDVETKSLELGLNAIAIEQRDKIIIEIQKLMAGGKISSLKDINFRLSEEMRILIAEALNKAVDFGKATVANELGISAGVTPSLFRQAAAIDIDNLLRMRAESLKTTIINTAKTAMLNKASPIDSAVNIYKKINEFNELNLKVISGMAVEDYFSMGRNIELDRNISKVQAKMRSEILDSQICDMCLAMDERVLPADDPFTKVGQLHTNCRGIWVSVLADEADLLPGAKPLPKSILDRFDTVEGVPQINQFRQYKAKDKVPVLKSTRAYEKLKDGDTLGRRTLKDGEFLTPSFLKKKEK